MSTPLPFALGARHRAVFLSPHPDDAIWSCGGRIAALIEAGIPVSIVTCFDGDDPQPPPPIEEPRRAPASPSLRRREDLLAVRELGAHHVSLGFVEANLRADRSGLLYRGQEAVFGQPVNPDRCIIPRLAQAIRQCLRPGDHLHIPLALGTHVDHALVREAVGLIPAVFPLHAYEEFPYAVSLPHSSATPEVVPVALEPWLRAALRYRSQVLWLFASAARFRETLIAWAGERGRLIDKPFGERYWSVRENGLS